MDTHWIMIALLVMVNIWSLVALSLYPTDINECLNTNLCEHTCYNTIGSYNCDCQAGFELSINGLSCSDINECLSNNGGCAQECINTVGSYQCRCGSGYTLDDDGLGCSGTVVYHCDSCLYLPIHAICRIINMMHEIKFFTTLVL